MLGDIGGGIVLLAVFSYAHIVMWRSTPERLLPQKVVSVVTGGVFLLFVHLSYIGAIDGELPLVIAFTFSVPALISSGWICVDHLQARALARAEAKAPAVEPRPGLRNFAKRSHNRKRKRLTCPSCSWEFSMRVQDLEARPRLPCPACGELHEPGDYQA